jgi:two-component system sensor histidine kinase SenX3
VSHELRTPVGAIGVLAETLVDESDPETIHRLAGRIRCEAERVGSIISDLLDLSRLEASGSDERAVVDIGEVVNAAAERVRPAAERSDVTVGVRPLPEARVTGDFRQLVSALANLLDNAVKYSDAGSRVELSVVVDGTVDVIVRDAGIGIPSRELGRIFERFYRVDRARSRQTGGTGLGLAIVRHIATNHGGEVLVDSREGEGSVFTFRLPREA